MTFPADDDEFYEEPLTDRRVEEYKGRRDV